MKPHIQKKGGVWWCGYRHLDEPLQRIGLGGHKSPTEAYISFINARTAWLGSYPLIA